MKGHLMVVGLGHSQVDLAREAKAAGLQVTGVGAGGTGPAAALCDNVIDADILNVQSLSAAARRCGADALFTLGMERALMPIALVSEELDLPCFFSSAVLRKLEDKGMWRAALQGVEGNLPFALGRAFEDFADWNRWPAFIKPSDGSGQRGVSKVDDPAELERRLPAALAASRNGVALLEDFADGDEVSVNLFLEGGEVRFFMLSDRFSHADLPGGIVKAHGVPSKHDTPAVHQAVRRFCEAVTERLGFRRGHLYFQLKVQGDRPALIEFTPRFDGCHMWKLICAATGVNLLRASLQLLFAGKTTEFDRPWTVEPHYLRFFSAPSGSTMNRRALCPCDDGVNWYYDDGATVKTVTGYLEKTGYGIYPGVFSDD